MQSMMHFQERCTAAETLSLVARVLNRSRPHLQSMLQNRSSIIENFFFHLVMFTSGHVWNN
jgi:syndetin